LQEGWQPGAFSSSRSAPGQRQQQSVEQFMDEDELEEMQKKGLSLKVGWLQLSLNSNSYIYIYMNETTEKERYIKNKRKSKTR
jgi:hypothetical protein